MDFVLYKLLKMFIYVYFNLESKFFNVTKLQKEPITGLPGLVLFFRVSIQAPIPQSLR